MRKLRWLLALPLLLATSLTATSAMAATIRDEAGLFSADAIRQAQTKLDRVERETRLTTTIETIDSLQGENIDDVVLRHAQQTKSQGIFILIAKQERKIEVRVSKRFRADFPNDRLSAIRDRFRAGFQQKDFDAGLTQGVDVLVAEAKGARPRGDDKLGRPAPAAGRPAGRPTSGIGSLLGIGLGILAILFIVRLLGNLFGGGQRAGYPGAPMAGPGGGPGGPGGPGFGGPGYGPGGYGGYGGGGRGGFWSSMFGGIGGAMAGNWLYDQFSGRHQQTGHSEGSFYGDGGASDSGTDPAGGDDWSGGGSVSGDWGGGDGGDWGGGDGGGDWGGGGGGDGDW